MECHGSHGCLEHSLPYKLRLLFLVSDLIEHDSGKLEFTEIEIIGLPRYQTELYGNQPGIKRSSARYV